MDVSIIIVNYNTRDDLDVCLASVFAHTSGLEFEVIVSDNGSTDGSIELVRTKYPGVILIENGVNLGFGAANNRGLDRASGTYVLYLNSDTELLNNAAKLFHDYWESNGAVRPIGSLGSNLLDAQGNIILSAGTFPTVSVNLKNLIAQNILNMILSVLYIFRLSADWIRRSVPNERARFGLVDYIVGADLFVKNDENARFDEDFFLYFEDTYLQFCMRTRGLRRVLIDGPRIRHLCGGSVGESFSIKRKASFSRIQYEYSRVRYLRKTGTGFLTLCIVKSLILLSWLNPFLLAKTRKHLVSLIQA